MSVDTGITGRQLDSYLVRRPLRDVEIFLDADLLPLPLEITVSTTAGLFRRSITVTVAGLNGDPFPNQLIG